MDTYVATRELGAGERQVIIVGISFPSTIGLDERQITFIILSRLRRCEATAVDGDTLARIADEEEGWGFTLGREEAQCTERHIVCSIQSEVARLIISIECLLVLLVLECDITEATRRGLDDEGISQG